MAGVRQMIALRIEDKKKFTSELFVGGVFDRFFLREAVIVTFNTFTIDGRIHQGYFTEEEREQERIGEYSLWSVVKPFCFSLIRGKKLPESFRIVLQYPAAAVERLLAEDGIAVRAEQVKGLYLNVRYDEGQIRCVTGTALDYFTMDKSLENAWDTAVERYFKTWQILFVTE